MIFENEYRTIKSSWGIAIDITAEYTSFSAINNKSNYYVELDHGLWGNNKYNKLSLDEEQFIWDGLKKVSKLIIRESPYKFDTLIILHSVNYNPTDYQIDGLTAAIIEWAANAFNFQKPNISVIFNKELNKYEFLYSSISKP